MTAKAAGLPNRSLDLANLFRIPDFVRDPVTHFEDIQSVYKGLQIDCTVVRTAIMTLSEMVASGEMINVKVLTLNSVAYGMLMTMAMVLNAILRSFDRSDVLLHSESEEFCDEALDLSKRVSQYRPLGSSYMPLALACAWAVTEDEVKRDALGDMMMEYQTDFESGRWLESAICLRKRLNYVRRTMSKAGETWHGDEFLAQNDDEPCCVQ